MCCSSNSQSFKFLCDYTCFIAIAIKQPYYSITVLEDTDLSMTCYKDYIITSSICRRLIATECKKYG